MTTIHVTEEDIAKGDVAECATCPIALAVRRQTTWRSAIVESDRICENATKEKYYEGFSLPIPAQNFIDSFDNGIPVSPFSFEIDIPKATETARS